MAVTWLLTWLLHGCYMTVTFPQVKPHPMIPYWFQNYFPAFFALDSWYYVHHATREEHRHGATTKAPQQQVEGPPCPRLPRCWGGVIIATQR